jgi:D-serine deaminase-like pyridoxal phosphate-dependent protein
MERPIFQAPGTPVEELDTPALVVDLDVMEQNIETFHDCFRQSAVKVRPHVSSHQCPQIAHRQLLAGATVGGISVSTVGEAEAFAAAGLRDILVASQIVTRPKIRRLCILAGANRITVAVDNPANVDYLSEAANAAGVTLGVLVEVDLGLGRCGVAPGGEALELARAIARRPGLRFDGLLAIPPILSADREIPPGPPLQKEGSGDVDLPDPAELEGEARGLLRPVVETRQLIEGEGLPVPVVSVGGTHNYDVACRMPGITEVQAGAYPLMDYHQCQRRPELSPAAKVLASVISRPTARSAVLDAGHKATGPDRGLAVLEGIPGAEATRFSAEHGVLALEGEAARELKPGDKAWLVPFDLGLCINQYDYVRAARGGRLEGFWPLAARGRFG